MVNLILFLATECISINLNTINHEPLISENVTKLHIKTFLCSKAENLLKHWKFIDDQVKFSRTFLSLEKLVQTNQNT